jgi:hypothetical protein
MPGISWLIVQNFVTVKETSGANTYFSRPFWPVITVDLRLSCTNQAPAVAMATSECRNSIILLTIWQALWSRNTSPLVEQEDATRSEQRRRRIVGTVTGRLASDWTIEEQRFDSWQEQDFFLLLTLRLPGHFILQIQLSAYPSQCRG